MALKRLRERLRRRGLKLMLDFYRITPRSIILE